MYDRVPKSDVVGSLFHLAGENQRCTYGILISPTCFGWICCQIGQDDKWKKRNFSVLFNPDALEELVSCHHPVPLQLPTGSLCRHDGDRISLDLMPVHPPPFRSVWCSNNVKVRTGWCQEQEAGGWLSGEVVQYSDNDWDWRQWCRADSQVLNVTVVCSGLPGLVPTRNTPTGKRAFTASPSCCAATLMYFLHHFAYLLLVPSSSGGLWPDCDIPCSPLKKGHKKKNSHFLFLWARLPCFGLIEKSPAALPVLRLLESLSVCKHQERQKQGRTAKVARATDACRDARVPSCPPASLTFRKWNLLAAVVSRHLLSQWVCVWAAWFPSSCSLTRDWLCRAAWTPPPPSPPPPPPPNISTSTATTNGGTF